MEINLLKKRGITRKSIRYFTERVLEWYVENKRQFPWRRKSATTYQRIVTEILLQRTRAEVISEFYWILFKQYSSWRVLEQASEDELKKLLKPIGLWKRRASVLALLSREMVKRKGVFPRKRKEIDLLPGVGQYVANAIELFGHGQARPLLDAGMARVLERCFGPRKLADIRYDPYLQELAGNVVKEGIAIEINWAILDFSALVCTRRAPKCLKCPINKKCNFVQDNLNSKF